MRAPVGVYACFSAEVGSYWRSSGDGIRPWVLMRLARVILLEMQKAEAIVALLSPKSERTAPPR